MPPTPRLNVIMPRKKLISHSASVNSKRTETAQDRNQSGVLASEISKVILKLLSA